MDSLSGRDNANFIDSWSKFWSNRDFFCFSSVTFEDVKKAVNESKGGGRNDNCASN